MGQECLKPREMNEVPLSRRTLRQSHGYMGWAFFYERGAPVGSGRFLVSGVPLYTNIRGERFLMSEVPLYRARQEVHPPLPLFLGELFGGYM